MNPWIKAFFGSPGRAIASAIALLILVYVLYPPLGGIFLERGGEAAKFTSYEIGIPLIIMGFGLKLLLKAFKKPKK